MEDVSRQIKILNVLSLLFHEKILHFSYKTSYLGLEPLLRLNSGNQSLKNCNNYIKANTIQCLSRVANHQSQRIKPSSHTKIESGEVPFVFM